VVKKTIKAAVKTIAKAALNTTIVDLGKGVLVGGGVGAGLGTMLVHTVVTAPVSMPVNMCVAVGSLVALKTKGHVDQAECTIAGCVVGTTIGALTWPLAWINIPLHVIQLPLFPIIGAGGGVVWAMVQGNKRAKRNEAMKDNTDYSRIAEAIVHKYLNDDGNVAIVVERDEQ